MHEAPDTASARPRRWSFWRIVLSLYLYAAALLVLCVATAGVAAFIFYDHVVQPGTPGPKVEVAIPAGSTGRDAGRILVEMGLLEREAFFLLALKLDGTNQVIRHGVYELPRGLSALELLRLLYKGPARSLTADQVRITVPEGLTIEQASALFPNPEAFRSAAHNPELIARLEISAASLEGFLMPNTYFFDAQPDEAAVVDRMVAQFEKEYSRLLREIPGADQFDKMTIVTVASLIEEETRVDEERPLVAAVIYNRIKKNMPLQMDSTLQFALSKYGQRMLESDKEVDSPYNTYKNSGLPPGPISSPGAASLRAALLPASASFLYFVSNADGQSHTFSASYQEHQEAVARYRREITVQRRELQQR